MARRTRVTVTSHSRVALNNFHVGHSLSFAFSVPLNVYCNHQSACHILKSYKNANSSQNVEFINNPARFSDVYRFRVTFECIALLKDGNWHNSGRLKPRRTLPHSQISSGNLFTSHHQAMKRLIKNWTTVLWDLFQLVLIHSNLKAPHQTPRKSPQKMYSVLLLLS